MRHPTAGAGLEAGSLAAAHTAPSAEIQTGGFGMMALCGVA